MPNVVTDMKRDKITRAIVEVLETITEANGYNTQPAIFEDPLLAREASERYILEVEDGDEGPVEHGLTGLDMWEQEIIVIGTAFAENDLPRVVRNRLLQDVRAAILGSRGTIISNVGSVSIQLGRCRTDLSAFLEDGYTMFEQTFVVRYPQTASW